MPPLLRNLLAFASGPARLRLIALTVPAEGAVDQLPHLIEIADRGCIMMNTLRGHLGVTIAPAITA